MKNKITKKFFKDVLVYSVGILLLSSVMMISFYLLECVIKEIGFLTNLMTFLLIIVLIGLFIRLIVGYLDYIKLLKKEKKKDEKNKNYL